MLIFSNLSEIHMALLILFFKGEIRTQKGTNKGARTQWIE